MTAALALLADLAQIGAKLEPVDDRLICAPERRLFRPVSSAASERQRPTSWRPSRGKMCPHVGVMRRVRAKDPRHRSRPTTELSRRLSLCG
jgi:hypothetical protein